MELIKEDMRINLNKILESDVPLQTDILNSKFLVIPVRSTYAVYGVLGMEVNKNKEGIIYENNDYQLRFLSELISNAFEVLTLEEINDRLLVTEEQNRIANEIHDSVLQRLFSMSCGMFSLIKKLEDFTTNEIKGELNEFREIIDYTMKELRNKIYGFSWKKSGSSSFNLDIKRFIDDTKRLNQVNIPFCIKGNIENISIEQKKALYRIICEGIGNAVRHGKAKNIEIILEISPHNTNISMVDDGTGFDLQKVLEDSTKGLGLQNMYQLTEILHGEINIESKLSIGTKIEIILPNSNIGEMIYEYTNC